MRDSSLARKFLKWASISWTVFAVAIIALSNIMITQNWSPVVGLEPFDVKNSFKVFMLLAPGALGAAIDLALTKRS
jgi:hypothetical protein